jgi:hypothetical protein
LRLHIHQLDERIKIRYKKKVSRSVQTPKIMKNLRVSRASFKPFLRGFDAAVLTGFRVCAGRAFVLFFDMIGIDLW